MHHNASHAPSQVAKKLFGDQPLQFECLCGAPTCKPQKANCQISSCLGTLEVNAFKGGSDYGVWISTCDVAKAHRGYFIWGQWRGEGCHLGIKKAPWARMSNLSLHLIYRSVRSGFPRKSWEMHLHLLQFIFFIVFLLWNRYDCYGMYVMIVMLPLWSTMLAGSYQGTSVWERQAEGNGPKRSDSGAPRMNVEIWKATWKKKQQIEKLENIRKENRKATSACVLWRIVIFCDVQEFSRISIISPSEADDSAPPLPAPPGSPPPLQELGWIWLDVDAQRA